MATPKIRVRGIRSPVLSGHVIGRRSANAGDAELIPFSDLAGIISQHGQPSGGGGGGATGANPTATASDAVVNGSAATFMRSDAAPPVQKTSSSVFGVAKVDGTTITAAAGVISAVGGGLYNQVMSATPTQAGTGFSSWLNQPASATVTDGATGVVVFCPTNSSHHTAAAIQKTVSGTYTHKALVALNSIFSASAGFIIGWTDGSKILACHIENGNGLFVTSWSALTSATETILYSETSLLFLPQLIWVSLADDGINVTIGVSMDGATYRTVYTEVKSTGHLTGYTTIAFGTDAFSHPTQATLLSWT